MIVLQVAAIRGSATPLELLVDPGLRGLAKRRPVNKIAGPGALVLGDARLAFTLPQLHETEPAEVDWSAKDLRGEDSPRFATIAGATPHLDLLQ